MKAVRIENAEAVLEIKKKKGQRTKDKMKQV